MTAVEEIPFEQLDGDRTEAVEALIKQRGTQDERRLIPRGTYEATLLEADLVRRKDGGGFVVRMVARTDRLGVYLISWRGLSTDATDPYTLTDNQVKSLRKFAESMGIPVPAPAGLIVQTLAAMRGEKVTAKVIHTPVGIQSTFTRETKAANPLSTSLTVAGRTFDLDPNGEVIDTRLQGQAAEAFTAHQLIVGGQQMARAGLDAICRGCHEMRDSRGWLALGYETLSEYLAQPDVELSKSEFERAADIWQTYVLDGGAAPELLHGAGPSKLEVPLHALKQGVVTVEQAAADAESMTRKDLREHYRALLGDEDEVPPVVPVERVDESPAGGTDDAAVKVVDGTGDLWLQRAEFDQIVARACDAEADVERLKAELEARPHQTDLTHHVLAQSLVGVLERVMREVGRPEQKRMSKDLRAAVTWLLEEARNQGLDVDAA